MATQVNTASFGKTETSEKVTLYILKSSTLEVSLADYGATIVSIKYANKNGTIDDVVTGFNDVQGYEKFSRYFGSTVGRVCNRIANGKFTLNGTSYSLPINNPPNSLHGGNVGFDKRIWAAQIEGENTVVFRLESKDGDQGYPGAVQATAKFVLNGSELLIQYSATTDKDTLINMTNHSYFNLAGHENWNKIYDHKITIHADHITPVTSALIPTGEVKKVEGTIFDLRTAALLTEERLDSIPNGYDHNFCLSSTSGGRRLAARVEHEKSGRVMEVETTQPGIQFYTGNFLDGQPSKNGGTYDKQTCFCLETQNWPDAINQVGKFPNAILRAGETYDEKTWYTFSTTQ